MVKCNHPECSVLGGTRPPPLNADPSYGEKLSQINDRLELVPASPNDAVSLAELRVVAMRESLERIGRFDPERARSRFLSSFSADTTRHIEVAGTRVGFAVVVPQPGHWLLDHLYIQPERQGAGIGSAVLLRLFAEADDCRAAIRVGALRESDSNRFYARHGFELVEQAEWDNYYLRPTARAV